jgi:hypothetical protein
MRSDITRVAAWLTLSALAMTPGSAAEGESWRAIAASAFEHTFATAMSGNKATEAEAIEAARSFCEEQVKECATVATFNSGCRYVMLGGRQVAPKTLEPVYLVGVSLDDAMRRCKILGLICEREPQGGCIE